MLIADPARVFEYVLECERELPETEQTIWLLRALTGREYARIQDLNIRMTTDLARESSQELQVTPGRVVYGTLALGLVGWRNFGIRDPVNGNRRLVEYSEEEIDRVPYDPAAIELAGHILNELSSVKKAEAKN